MSQSPLIITQIAAMAQNRVIGAQGALPWHLSEDLRFFKQTTLGHAMIVGRKTFDSFGGKALPGRLNIVVTRTPGVDSELVRFVTSLEAAFALCLNERARWGDEVFVAGGGEIYRAAMAATDRIWLTQVRRDVDGDTTFPDIPADFVAECTTEFREPFAYARTLYVRKRAGS